MHSLIITINAAMATVIGGNIMGEATGPTGPLHVSRWPTGCFLININ